MGRRVLAFFLGLIFGIILVVGGVAAAIYVSVCVVKVEKIVPEANNFLGDLSQKSIYDIGKEIYGLYSAQIGVKDENGNYYTVEQFFANYNIDPNTAFGTELPQEVLQMPAFEFFSEGGFERASKQIKVSTVPAIVNLFGGKSEDGASNGMFGENVMTELSKYSMHDLLNEEIGVAGVFSNVKIADILPNAFPSQDSDNKIMWAVGQTSIGKALNGMSGGQNIMLQLKADGAFESVGALELTAVLGESQYINALLGSNAKICDLIDDNGNIRFDDIINGVSVGELLGCQKNKIEDVTDYVAIDGQDPDSDTLIMQKTDGENTVYVKCTDGENWYEVLITCTNEEDGHTHTAECFGYAWYSTAECAQTHTHQNSTDMIKDGVYYPRAEGLYAVLSSLSISDFTSGNDNALMDKIKTLKIKDIINGADVNGIMNAFVELTIEELMNGAIEDLYLGEFFNYERLAINNIDAYDQSNVTEIKKDNDTTLIEYYLITDAENNIALSTDNKNWYEGKLVCEKTEPDHVHSESCYTFVWYKDSAHTAIADGIQGKFANNQISDLQNLNEEIQRLTLRDMYEDGAIPSMLTSIADTPISELNNAIKTMYLGEFLQYTRTLECAEDHEHVNACYKWYKSDGSAVDGMMAKLADKQVNELGDLNNTIKEFTLRDVLGDDIPAMLKSIADTTIADLNNAINTMYLGEFLEYTRTLECTENHEHVNACYKWYKSDGSAVDGMMAKLADKQVNELGDLNNTIKDFTLRDVLGDDIPEMLKDVADTKISELDSAINSLYLGSAMQYARKETLTDGYTDTVIASAPESAVEVRSKTTDGVTSFIKTDEGEKWYEAEITCTKTHVHTADCYKYIWRDKNGEPVEGIAKAFVNCKLNNIDVTMDNMTLRELGISSDGNNILKAIEDVPVMEIGDHINNVKMGEVLGYTKGERLDTTTSCEEDHTHTDDCYDYVWYEDSAKTTAVKGLNGKIANLTVGGMNGGAGLSSISASLTIGDLIDSGMMEINENDEYKFAIICCDGDADCDCSLAKYIAATTVNSSLTAQQYWESTHASYAGDKEAHKNVWRNLTLNDFMNMLLRAI